MNFSSKAAQILVALIPIVAIVMAAVLVFFAFLWKHRENKTRIIKGSYNPPQKRNYQAFSLLLGLCLVGVGLVLTALFAIMDKISWSILGGLIPLVLGIALLIFYKINPDFKNNSTNSNDSGKNQDEEPLL